MAISAETVRAAESVHSILKEWPPHSYSLVDDLGPPEPTNLFDDYVVERQLSIQPNHSNACPVDILFVASGKDMPYVALGFDRWNALAKRIGVKSDSQRFVFGFEPRSVTANQIRTILGGVALGKLEAFYVSVFGRLIAADGRVLTSVGLPRIEAVHFGKIFRYRPYAP